jgi:hypothetical protein
MKRSLHIGHKLNSKMVESTTDIDFFKISFLALGAAYGTARSGIGIAGIGPFRPELVMKVGIHHSIRSMRSH